MIQSCVGSTVSKYTSDVVSDASRSLELLRAIESTIASLTETANQMAEDIRLGQGFINGINQDTSGRICDPDGIIEDNLLSAQGHVEVLHQALQQGRSAAMADKSLRTGDGVEDAYNIAIANAADLHNILNTLRWVIMEHDADLETGVSERVYGKNDIPALMAELDSLKIN